MGVAPAAAAMACGIRGDDEGRREWLGILAEMRRVVAPLVGDKTGYIQVFDGLVALHRGEFGDALIRLAGPPDQFKSGTTAPGAWRQWYAAVWAEAALLADRADRHERIARARFVTAHNPIASAMVDRVEALASDDIDKLLVAAAARDAAGCRYQHGRTLVFAGGGARVEGEEMLAAIGATPMAI